MMRKALLITVGTGVGNDKEKAVESLARGIAYSIKIHNPDKVVFVTTAESERDTLPRVLREVELDNYAVKRLRDFSDIESIYEDIVSIMRELQDEGFASEDIVVDYTSGTKAMSAGAAIAGALSEVETLSYINGKREGGIVVRGTEKLLPIRPYKILIDNKLKTIKELFNTHQFDACLKLIEDLKAKTANSEVQEKLAYYEAVCSAYSAWDKFEHERASEILKEIKGEFADNKKFLGKMLKSEDREPFLIADLLNNARRRMEEGKYDDAVARLYRTMELIAQYALRKKYGIDSSDVDTWHLKTLGGVGRRVMEKYEALKGEDGRIRLALRQDYELLKDLGDELGQRFSEDNEMQNLLGKRNASILAHGLEPVSREDAERLLLRVKEYAGVVVSDLEGLSTQAEFPRL
ncbi:MAG: TIGR02710 family CRISPR-associated protein [Candidatus Alkanophagales archaeon]|nr:MAG: TIGR02710 family CRISPR-associated protein [Candidatus Alkanophagales archaeon]